MSAGPSPLTEFCPWAAEPTARLYLRPLVNTAGLGSRLAGGWCSFDQLAVTVRDPARVETAAGSRDELRDWAAARNRAAELDDRLAALTAPRAPIAGLAPDRPLVMGIVNVTPDSFSDGGRFFDEGRAIAHGLALAEAGADILDVGGESTRPGAAPVDLEEELRRTLPVVQALVRAGHRVSIDTSRAAVMRAALDAGAVILNDVTALAGPGSLKLAAACGAPVILMHMAGEPRTMQAAPSYRDAALDIFDHLESRVAVAEAAGIARARIVVDFGIGFGKTVAHNVALLRQAALFHGLGCPVLAGVSRKGFIGRLSRGEPATERLAGSLTAGIAALAQGVQLLRVHDVAETVQAIAVWRSIQAAAIVAPPARLIATA